MSLLAEQLVEEWLNRQGFFTIRGVRDGVHEIDLLAIRPSESGVDAWHIEVQVSFRPIGYLGQLSPEQQKEMSVRSKNSAKTRNTQQIEESITDWVKKKYHSHTKISARERAWKDAKWKMKFVHGVVKENEELVHISNFGIDVIPFSRVLDEICNPKQSSFVAGSGTDIAEILKFYKPNN